MQNDDKPQREKTAKEIEMEALRAEQTKKAEDLKNAARRLFTTKDGIVVAKAMMRISNIYNLSADLEADDKMLRALAGRTFMYNYFIKGLLTSEQLVAIESVEKK